MTATAPPGRPIPGAATRLAAQVSALLPAVETARTRLRAPTPADFEVYAAIACDPVRSKGLRGPFSRDEAYQDFAAMIGTWALYGFGLWAVDHESACIGFVLIYATPDAPEPELGYFFSAEAEGRGLACEAAVAARDIAFGPLALPSLVSYIGAGNARSIALCERIGAEQVESSKTGTVIFRHRRPE